mgnify:CR=1 FL=1
MIERLKLQRSVAESRYVLYIKNDGILICMKYVCNVIRVLDNLCAVSLSCEYLIGENFTVGIRNLEAVRFPLGRKLDGERNRFTALERCRVEDYDCGIVPAP